MNLDVSNFLGQAKAAAQQENWSLLTRCLQQLVASETFIATPESEAREQVLALALDGLAAGDFQQRWGVAKLISQLSKSQPQAIAALITILQDEDSDLELRWFTARILGEFDQPEVVTALVELLQTSDDEDLTASAAEALAKLGPAAINVLSDLLIDERTRLLAVRSLCQIHHSQIIAPLLSVLQDPQVAVRATAIEALSSFHDPQIPPVLVNALADPAAQVRRAAVYGLGFRMSLELDLVEVICPLLRDLNLDVCQQAANTLGRLGTDAAAAALFETLPNTQSALQVTLVRALGRIETPRSLEYLRQALALQSITVWQEIATVLGRVGQPDLSAQAVEILTEVLRSQHPATQVPTVKQSVALGLGHLGQTSAINPLIELLADADAGVRLHAIAALKKLAPSATHQQLLALEKDHTLRPELKQGVAIALQEW